MISKINRKKYGTYLLQTVILFILLIVVLMLTHAMPDYAYPTYLLHSASLKELVHTFVFGVIWLLISVFLVIFFHKKWYLTIWKGLAASFTNIITDIRARSRFWLINVIGWFVILLVSFLIELFYGHVIIGKVNSLGTYFSPYRMGFFFFLLLLIFTLARFRSVTLKPERAFVLISLTAGLLLCCTMQKTAAVSWDDETHYIHSIEHTGIGTIYETEADKSILEHTYPFSFNMKENAEMTDTLDQEHVSGQDTRLDRKYARTYQQLAYLPSALAQMIGRGLGVPFHILYAMGRMANLIVYTILIYFAMRKLKSGKLILMVIALFPTTLFLASSYSYDPWVTGFTILGLSYLFYHLQTPEETVSKKDALVMLLSFFVGFSAKAIYFPITLLLLLLRKDKFTSRRSYRRFVIGVLLVTLIVAGSFAVPMLFHGPSTDTRGGSDVNAVLQLAFILDNPGKYFGIMMNFLKEYVSIENTGNYTSNFAFFGFAPHAVLTMVLLFIVTFIDKRTCDRYTCNAKTRIAIAVIAYITVCLVVTSLYIAYTPVGDLTIAGCQPRYLIPILFPIFYVLGGPVRTNYFLTKTDSCDAGVAPKTNRIHYYCVYAALVFILMSIIWQLFVSQYV